MHYEQALGMWDAAGEVELPVDRVEITRRAADAALLAGEYDRAIALANEGHRPHRRASRACSRPPSRTLDSATPCGRAVTARVPRCASTTMRRC